jgi:hypothetical protein
MGMPRAATVGILAVLAAAVVAGPAPAGAQPSTGSALSVPPGATLKATVGGATAEVVVRGLPEVRATWQPTKVAGAPRPERWTLSTVGKEIVPLKYEPSGNAELLVEVTAVGETAAALGATVEVALVDLLASPARVATHELRPTFDARGATTLRFKLGDLLEASGARLNRNAFEARVKLKWEGRSALTFTEKPLHVLRQKLILFIPGVGGSRITVASHPDGEAYPAISMVAFGSDKDSLYTAFINWLRCKPDGTPVSPAVHLDLFRYFARPEFPVTRMDDLIVRANQALAGKETEVYTVDTRKEVESPAHHPVLRRLGAGTGGGGSDAPYYVVKSWPYDWRLRLEDAVSLLMGRRTRRSADPVWPPYQTPPPLARVVQEAQKTYPFLDERIAIAAHSTGGLITRAVLQEAGVERYVDRAFFIDVPFWGAPKAYWVFMTGDMGLPFISIDFLRDLAPNLPILYYLAPTERYPEVVARVAGREIQRTANQRVGDFMVGLVREARKSQLYPGAGQIDVWNDGLEQAARSFHATLTGPPRIGFENTTVFTSNSSLPTIGLVRVDATVTGLPDSSGIAGVNTQQPEFRLTNGTTRGDGTVPIVSQIADFPPSTVLTIPGGPGHVEAPNTAFVWESIVRILGRVEGQKGD